MKRQALLCVLLALLLCNVCGQCDFVKVICNTVKNKAPLVSSSLPVGDSITRNLTLQEKHDFEHLLGHAFRNTSGVKWISQTFLDRMTSVLQKAAFHTNKTSPKEALLNSYGAGGDQHNTGFVGPDLEALNYALSPSGNIREKWALIYILLKNKYFDSVIMPIAEKANSTGDLSFLEDTLQMNASAVIKRFLAVSETDNELDHSLKYSNGIPSMAFEPFDSWVRFLFDGPPDSWDGVRNSKPGGCQETDMLSNDSSLYPPLSPYEKRYQCGGQSLCKLAWYPGIQCYDIEDTPFAKGVPGYVTRATALGYRVGAGPSGTTANVLQYGVLLGLDEGEMVLLRLAMAAWMIPTNDHSFYEILLGADDFMPEEYRLVKGLNDVRMIMPNDVIAKGVTFRQEEVWQSLGTWLQTNVGQRIMCTSMTPASRHYLTILTGVIC